MNLLRKRPTTLLVTKIIPLYDTKKKKKKPYGTGKKYLNEILLNQKVTKISVIRKYIKSH